MEPNEELKPVLIEEPEVQPKTEAAADEEPEMLPNGRYNLEICPNCLEPNEDDLAVCRYCGQPLNPNAEVIDISAQPEDEKTLEANRAAAVPEKKTAQKQESGFRRVMPRMGLYLIYFGVTGIFDMRRQIKAAEEAGEAVNTSLAYLSQGIWILAGILMAWPLIKKGYRKLRHLPEEDAEPDTASDAVDLAEESAASEIEAESSENDWDEDVIPESAPEEPDPEENDEQPEA